MTEKNVARTINNNIIKILCSKRIRYENVTHVIYTFYDYLVFYPLVYIYKLSHTNRYIVQIIKIKQIIFFHVSNRSFRYTDHQKELHYFQKLNNL